MFLCLVSRQDHNQDEHEWTHTNQVKTRHQRHHHGRTIRSARTCPNKIIVIKPYDQWKSEPAPQAKNPAHITAGFFSFGHRDLDMLHGCAWQCPCSHHGAERAARATLPHLPEPTKSQPKFPRKLASNDLAFSSRLFASPVGSPVWKPWAGLCRLHDRSALWFVFAFSFTCP